MTYLLKYPSLILFHFNIFPKIPLCESVIRVRVLRDLISYNVIKGIQNLAINLTIVIIALKFWRVH